MDLSQFDFGYGNNFIRLVIEMASFLCWYIAYDSLTKRVLREIQFKSDFIFRFGIELTSELFQNEIKLDFALLI